MHADWFLTDAPHVVPREFAAWTAARARHARLVLQLAETPNDETTGECFHQLALAEIDARQEASRLKRIARLAWRRRR